MASLKAEQLFHVKDLVFVITGGGSGLGESMALALDANGASKVFVLGRRQAALERTAEKAINRSIVPVTCDVASKDSLENAVKTISAKTSFVNAVIASSGITGPMTMPPPRDPQQALSDTQKDLWATSFELSQKTMDINVFGSFYTFVAFLSLLEAGNTDPASRGKRDSIQSQFITVSSMAGFTRSECVGYAYMASKAALIHLTKTISTNFAKHGIRANSIAPGLYITEMTDFLSQDGQDLTKPGSMSKDSIPATRSGAPEDIAGAILYLTSRAGSFVNGAILVTDGGQMSIEPGTF